MRTVISRNGAPGAVNEASPKENPSGVWNAKKLNKLLACFWLVSWFRALFLRGRLYRTLATLVLINTFVPGCIPVARAEPPVSLRYLQWGSISFQNLPQWYRVTEAEICNEVLPAVWNPYLSSRSTAISSSYLGVGNPSGRCSITYRTDDGQTYTSVNGWIYTVSWCANGYKPDAAKPWAQQCGIGNQSIYPGTQIPVSTLTDQSCSVGNPCSVGAGLKRQNEVDFVASGPQPLTLKRIYQSSYLVPPLDGFGALWMHEWQRRLDLSKYSATTPSLSALRGDGTSTTFALSGGIWTATDGKGDQAIAVSDAGGTGQGFRLTDRRSDRTEDYDASGKLLVVKERNGWITSLKYSDVSTPTTVAPHVNLLIEIRNHFGQTIRFAYDISGRINSATMPDGTILLYGYETYGMLSTVTYAGGAPRQYHYENSQFVWALTGITDEKGVRFSSYGYDSLGRATSTEHAGGVDKFQLSFLGNGQTSVTTADGTNRTFSSELQGNVLRATGASAPCPACGDIAKAVSYDAAGNVATRRDFADKETRYSYDALGRETQRIEGYGTADAKTTTSEWHPTWNLPQKVAAPGRVDYFSYDAKGHVLVYGWYPTNDVTGGQGLNVQPSGDVTSTTWTYDENGLVATAVDKVGDTVTGQWSFAYDAQGNLTTVTNGAGQIGYAVQYDAAGRLLEAVDVNGSRVKYAYDARGRMTDVDIDGIHTRYEYDAVGQLVGVVGPYDLVTRYTYDAAHRLIQILDNITIPEHVTESSPVSPFSVDGEASPSSLAYVSNRLVSGWNAVLRWLKDWLSGIIRSAHAQTTPPLPNSYAPPLRPGQSIPTFPGSSAAVDLDPSLTPEKATPRMYAMQFLVRVQKACGEVLEAVVSAFDKSTPPGDCDDDEYTKLKTNVDQSCKTGQQYCKAGDSPALLVSKRDALQACANARRKIMNVCFRGGDKAHQRDWVKVVQQVDICNGL
ncbi:DUF6531 domain-containing protein [Cupriavidus sp. KB_39]|uniref:DUF6531 domain-containing protein n=1 Tax=Cupriavidus sp. KB_39 TaxID=3233036 RepID=UPI003F93B847